MSTMRVTFELPAAAWAAEQDHAGDLARLWHERRNASWKAAAEGAGMAATTHPHRFRASLSFISLGETPSGERPRIARMTIDVDAGDAQDAITEARRILDLEERRPPSPNVAFHDDDDGDLGPARESWLVGRRLTAFACGRLSGADNACAWQANSGSWILDASATPFAATQEHEHPSADGKGYDVEIVHHRVASPAHAREIASALHGLRPEITFCRLDADVVIEAASQGRTWRFRSHAGGPARLRRVHDVEMLLHPSPWAMPQGDSVLKG